MGRAMTTEEFIKKAIGFHGNKYNYSKVHYVNNHTKVEIICPKHGSFFMIPCNHAGKLERGCPKCRASKGEQKVREYLEAHNIQFVEQKRFKECKDKGILSFDFYIPSLNTAIEYNGKQHYEAIGYFGGEEKLHIQRRHDSIKRKFCKSNNIKLITIKYTKDVNDVLNLKLNLTKS